MESEYSNKGDCLKPNDKMNSLSASSDNVPVAKLYIQLKDTTSDPSNHDHSTTDEADDSLTHDPLEASDKTPLEAQEVNAVRLSDGRLALFSTSCTESMLSPILMLGTEDADRFTEDETSVSTKQIHVDDHGVMYLIDVDDSQQSHAVSKVKKRKVDNHPKNVNQSWFTSRSDRDFMSEKGGNWRRGLWQKDEQDLLERNINDYCEQIGICDPTEIIFHMSKDDRKDFYRTISKGLKRPLFSVYRRVIRNYDPKNYRGKYSLEDSETLKKLHEEYGNDWVTIGATMGRSASSVKDKCRLMQEKNGGKWLPKEEDLLIDAVQQLQDDGSKNLNWMEISKHVSTRTAKQCRAKWLNYLSWKVKGGVEWTQKDELSLPIKLSRQEAKHELDIDWEALAADWPSARSPQWLRGKWWTMKRHIPNYQSRTLTELLDYFKYSERELSTVNSIELSESSSNQLQDAPSYERNEFITCTESSESIDSLKTTETQSQDKIFSHQNFLVPQGFHVNSLLDGQYVTQSSTESSTSGLHNEEIVSMELDETGQLVLTGPFSIDPESHDLHAVNEKSEPVLVDEIVISCHESEAGNEAQVDLLQTPLQKYTPSNVVLIADPMMVSNNNDIHEDKR